MSDASKYREAWTERLSPDCIKLISNFLPLLV